MGGSASYRLARKIRAAEQNGASQDEIDALRRQREAALAAEREKRQRQRDQNENRVRIPDGFTPTGLIDGSEYTRPQTNPQTNPQIQIPSGAYLSDDRNYTIVRPGGELNPTNMSNTNIPNNTSGQTSETEEVTTGPDGREVRIIRHNTNRRIGWLAMDPEIVKRDGKTYYVFYSPGETRMTEVPEGTRLEDVHAIYGVVYSTTPWRFR